MKKIITSACILLVTAMFSPALAQDGPTERRDRQGDRINKHLDRKGDQINRKLDRKGDRIEARFDRKADMAREAGKYRLARKMERKGDRINRKLDSLISERAVQGMDVHYMAPDDETLKEAMDKYTRWIDDQIANVDQSVDQEAKHNN